MRWFRAPKLRVTCVLARPGRYEFVWDGDHNTPRSAAVTSPPTLPISQPIYEEIHHCCSAHDPEVGGLLLGPQNNRIVTHFLFDPPGVSHPEKYIVDHAKLNRAIQPLLACGINIKGIVHSHPPGRPQPSEGDRQYLEGLLLRPWREATELFFPVWCDHQLLPFIVTSTSVRQRQHWALPAQIVLV